VPQPGKEPFFHSPDKSRPSQNRRPLLGFKNSKNVRSIFFTDKSAIGFQPTPLFLLEQAKDEFLGKPIPSPAPGQITRMAAPFIGFQVLYHPSSQGIPVNVLQYLQKIRVRFHEDRPVAPSKQGTIATVRPIVTLRINTIDMAHAAGEVGLGGLDQKMVVLCEVLDYVKLSSPPL
jgi:hypothetical protein